MAGQQMTFKYSDPRVHYTHHTHTTHTHTTHHTHAHTHTHTHTTHIPHTHTHTPHTHTHTHHTQIATRKTYGDALVKLGKNFSRIIAVDKDTKNSTFSLTYKKAFDDRYIECFVAEQNLVGIGIGLACRDRNIVFCSTYAVSFTRAFDQIRMGAISLSKVNFVGSHAGCSIGEYMWWWFTEWSTL